MDRFAYLVKRFMPGMFTMLERLARSLAAARFGRRIDSALSRATVTGDLDGRMAVMRPLSIEDLQLLEGFFTNLPDHHLHYFRPHGFSGSALERVLSTRAILAYGLFIDGELSGYGLLKISPTGSAFLGLLVAPGNTGLGLGKFLVGYLYWQASLAGLRTRSTVSKNNPASIRAHEAVSPFRIVSELPDDYLMIEFPDRKMTMPGFSTWGDKV